MKRLLSLLVIVGSVLTTINAHAQFKSVPSAVTDAFKDKYPHAANVKWSAGLQASTATFTMDGDEYTARYDNKGKWENSTRKISQDALPAAVKDGLSKSKYGGTEWKVNTVTERFLPGNVNRYVIYIEKSDLQKKNLTFTSKGKLVKDAITI